MLLSMCVYFVAYLIYSYKFCSSQLEITYGHLHYQTYIRLDYRFKFYYIIPLRESKDNNYKLIKDSKSIYEYMKLHLIQTSLLTEQYSPFLL